MVNLLHGDCLELMKNIPDKSIDLILCDLPYNTTKLKWDIPIPFDVLWKQYERIIKSERAIVLFAQQPFTTLLISSNMKLWKYNWVWEKENGTNFMNSHYCPLKVTEDICVFGDGGISPSKGKHLRYFPQFVFGNPYIRKSRCGKRAITRQNDESAVIRDSGATGYVTKSDGRRYPTNVLTYNRDKEKYHPTQKPVALLEYLIETYTLAGETVLDNCLGSGSTGVAAVNTRRNFIGMEKDKFYYDIAKRRIDKASESQSLFNYEICSIVGGK